MTDWTETVWLPAPLLQRGWLVSVDGTTWTTVGRVRFVGLSVAVQHVDPADGDDLGTTDHDLADDLDVRIPCEGGWTAPLALPGDALGAIGGMDVGWRMALPDLGGVGGWHEVTSLTLCEDGDECPVELRGEDCQGVVELRRRLSGGTTVLHLAGDGQYVVIIPAAVGERAAAGPAGPAGVAGSAAGGPTGDGSPAPISGGGLTPTSPAAGCVRGAPAIGGDLGGEAEVPTPSEPEWRCGA